VPVGRANREPIEALTARVSTALRAMLADVPQPPASRGIFGWLTEALNDWGEGTPEAIERARQRREVVRQDRA